MSLTLVATPIGHQDDLSFRAKQTLLDADVIVVEEFKESTKILRAHGIKAKALEQLNEHSNKDDLERLFALTLTQNVVLISDCGTPGFQDPGSDLVALCRAKGVAVKALPGASSLTTLLSLSSRRINAFVFAGFLPANTEQRAKALEILAKETRAVVVMDTPYRFKKMLTDFATHFPDRRILLGLNLTQETEVVVEDLGRNLSAKVQNEKAEFVALIYSKV